jgi:hypothetical protein
VMSLAVVTLPRGQRRVPWAALVFFVAVSAGANVLHALDQPSAEAWSPAVAALPPLALPLCVWVAERVMLAVAEAVRAPAHRERVESAHEVVVEPVSAAREPPAEPAREPASEPANEPAVGPELEPSVLRSVSPRRPGQRRGRPPAHYVECPDGRCGMVSPATAKRHKAREGAA